LKDPVKFLSNFDISSLILTNGNNVGEAIKDNSKSDSYSQSTEYSFERDSTETVLVDFARKKKIPILGVCRGLQFLNVYFGGNLSRNLKTLFPNEKHVAHNHIVTITDESMRNKLNKQQYEVNSFHNQGVQLTDLAKPLIPFAVANQLIEGFYHSSENIIAVQWHPERETPNLELDNFIMSTHFINKETQQ